MADMLKSSLEEDQRKRGDAQLYSVQQQIDELRRQLKEESGSPAVVPRNFTGGRRQDRPVANSQDRLTQDVAQNPAPAR